MERFSSFSSSKVPNEANGFIFGKYIPSKENFLSGTISIDDLNFQCTLSPKFVYWLQRRDKKQIKDFLRKKQLFQVWVRQKRSDAPNLVFHVISCPDIPEPDKKRLADFFCVRGELYSWNNDAKKIRIKIFRNKESTRPAENWRPFFLDLVGNLPCKKNKGERWEMQCLREGNQLLVSSPMKIIESQSIDSKLVPSNESSLPKPKPKPKSKKTEPLLVTR
jgi:hypothetical protein